MECPNHPKLASLHLKGPGAFLGEEPKIFLAQATYFVGVVGPVNLSWWWPSGLLGLP